MTDEELLLDGALPKILNPFKESYDWISPAPLPYPHPLFPHEDIRTKWDEFGQVVDVKDFAKAHLGMAMEIDSSLAVRTFFGIELKAVFSKGVAAGTTSMETDEMKDGHKDIPTKGVVVDKLLNVQCTVLTLCCRKCTVSLITTLRLSTSTLRVYRMEDPSRRFFPM